MIFTSGGTEADNLAIIGAALAAARAGRARWRRRLRHRAQGDPGRGTRRGDLGGEEIILPVDADGIVRLDALDAALARQPAVVSVMWVNNEVGVVQPVAEIAARCQAAGVPLHTDAVQAFGKVPSTFATSPVTLLTLSGHKIGAPKGIGALVVRDRGRWRPSSTAAASSTASARAPRTWPAPWRWAARRDWRPRSRRPKRRAWPRCGTSWQRGCCRDVPDLMVDRCDAARAPRTSSPSRSPGPTARRC